MCTLKGISLACCARILRVCARKGQRQQGGRRGLPQSPWCSRRTYCSSHCVSAKTWSMHSSITLMVRAFNLCHWNPPGNSVRHGSRTRLRVLDLAKRLRPQPCPHPRPHHPRRHPRPHPCPHPLTPTLIPNPRTVCSPCALQGGALHTLDDLAAHARRDGAVLLMGRGGSSARVRCAHEPDCSENTENNNNNNVRWGTAPRCGRTVRAASGWRARGPAGWRPLRRP